MILTIFILLIVIFLAVFIGKNLSYVCTFWFFKTFENLPVSVLVLIAFGVGIALSLLVLAVTKLVKSTSVKNEEVSTDKKAENEKKKLERAEKKAMKDAKKLERAENKAKQMKKEEARTFTPNKNEQDKKVESSEDKKTSDNL